MRCKHPSHCRPLREVANSRGSFAGQMGMGLAALTAAVGLIALPSSAQTLYWDLNGAGTGAGGGAPSGSWEQANWSLDLNGTTATGLWNSGATAVFSAGSDATGLYTITLGSPETAGGLSFATGTATLSGSALTLTGSGLVGVNATPAKGILACVVSGSVGLTKTNAGELVLQAANTFTGDLTVRAGTLTLDNDQAASAGNITLNPSSPVVLHSSRATTTLANPIVFFGTTSTIDVSAEANNTLVLNGALSGSHAWNVAGAGTVVLGGSAANTFNGALTVAKGTLVVAKDQALGATLNNTVVNPGGTLAFVGGFEYTTPEPPQAPKGIILKGAGVGGGAALNNLDGNNTFDGTVTLAADAVVGASAGSLALNGPVSGNFNLTKVGTGIVDMFGIGNGFANTLIKQGTLGVWGSSVLGTGTVTVNSGARLEGNGSAPGVNLSGTISPGGSPDSLATGSETWNSGASYEWHISDATGFIGANPGYDLLLITGALTINASAANPITVRVYSLDPSFDVAGAPADFDNTQEYNWTIASASSGITGFSADKFTIDASGFTAPLGGGKFVLLQAGNNLVLRFDPAPVISCPDAIVQDTAASQCGASVAFAASATDNQSGVSITYVANGVPITSPWPFATGTTTVAATATDSVGNTAVCTFTVTINDAEKPAITAPTDVTVNTDAGLCSAAKAKVALGTPVTSDNCGVAVVSNNAPDPFPKGTTTVTWTVVDMSGNTATATQKVTVEDHEKPKITGCPATLYVLSPNGQSQVVNWTAPTASDNCGVTNFTSDYHPGDSFPVGKTTVTYTAVDAGNNQQTCTFDVVVVSTTTVYVDAGYTGPNGTSVSWPNNNGTGAHYLGYDAFATIQNAINQAATGGTVKVAAGTYVEGQNVTVDKALTLLGPNAGKAGADASRGPEAIVKPGINDADYTAIISVVASNVVVDGFLLDGSNPGLGDYYHANGVTVNAAAAVQNGVYGSLVDVDHITIQNNILANVSYDGIYLDLTLGRPNGWNYIVNNKFANMWEGLQTYALHSVISNNTFVSVSRGLSLHGTITPAPDGFTPGVVSNRLSIAEWFPLESENSVVHAPGIWINYRREQAAPLQVIGNVIQTPVAPPAGKVIVGLYALDVDGQGSVQFIDNVVNGAGNCTYGLFVAQCPSKDAVQLRGGALNQIASAGVLLDTVDFNWGPGDSLATISDVAMTLSPDATGVRAFQEASTPSLKAVATVMGNTTISGGAAGVQVQGANAAASVLNNQGAIAGNVVGVDVDSGKALIEHSDLTGNTEAGIRVENGAVVDAGDCGSDVTGLGVSTGANNLSGYGFDNSAPWAIENLNPAATPAVLAQHNNFGSVAGDTIAAAFQDANGSVAYSQSPTVISAPPAANLVCASEIPAGATDLAGFIAQGGYYPAGAASVSFSDSTNLTGSGTLIRTYTLTDACGVASTATQTVQVSDTVKPVLTVPAGITKNTEPNACTATVAITPATATDNCGVASVVGVRSDGLALEASYPDGVTVITWTATDTSGNTDSGTQTVTVEDHQNPTIEAPALVLVNADAGHCYATSVALGTPVKADNCAVAGVSNNAPVQFALGTNLVTWTVFDASGNTGTAGQLVVVLDKEAPSLVVPDDITVTTTQPRDPYFTGSASASDNCSGAANPTYNDDRSGLTNCDATGVIVRTWTATDAVGNTTNRQQLITVIDTTTPQFTFVPADQTVRNEAGYCSAAVSYAPPTAKVVAFSEGFEYANWSSGDYNNNPSVGWNDYNSHISQVASGTDGIVSRSGTAHAVIDSTVSATQGDSTGAFCRLGGYNGVFGEGFRVAQDVYIDLNDAKVKSATTDSGYAWDLSAATATPSLGYGRDFVFHAAAYDATGVVIGVNNNSTDSAADRGGDLRQAGTHATLTTSGWFTFEWVFRNANGVLAVDMSVRDASGAQVFTQTLSEASDTIPDAVGGNRYLWFTFLNVDKLAIDNTVLERFVPVTTSLASGSTFQVGTNTVVCTAMNACNDTVNTTNFTVTVLDTEKPSITAPSDLAEVPAALGLCVATNVVLGTPTTSDNCDIATVTNDAPANFPLGDTVVTWTAVDIHGNINTATQRVTVVDREGPVITTCAANRVIEADVTAHAALPDLTGEIKATDCSPPLVITQQPPAQTLVGLGDTQVTVFVADAAGNTTPCKATITVRDVTPPAITCPLNVTVTTLQAKDPYATGYATATDAGGAVTISYVDDIRGLTNCNSTGVLFRTWMATDPSNNVSSCVQTLTIVDTNVPYFVSVPADITVNNGPGQCSAVVQYPAPVARDLAYFQGFEDPNFVADTNANLLTFVTGQSLDWTDLNSRLYRVPSGTDGIASRSGAAHGIIDSTGAAAGPSYKQSGAYTWMGGLTSPFGTGYRVALDVYLNLSDPAVTGATATTGYGWDLDTAASDPTGLSTVRNFVFHTAAYDSTGIVVGADMSGVSSPAHRRDDLLGLPNHAVIASSGWYTFEWLFHEADGALAVDLSVLDATGKKVFTQTLSNSNDRIDGIGGNPSYMWAIFVYADKLPIDNTTFERNVPVNSSMPSGSTFAVGTTTVTNVATDACGHTASSTFTVTVNDTEQPTANVPDNIVVDNQAGQCSALVSFVIPSNWDNCGIDTVSATPPSGSTFDVGTTEVTVVVKDIHGNSATKTFSVTVKDSELPTVAQPADIVQAVDSGKDYATVTFTLPTGDDNCGVASVTASPASGSQFPVGKSTVTVQVTDIHDNRNTTTFSVEVIGLPAIVQQPASRTNFAGSTAVFSVNAVSPAPLTYQWRRNNAPIAGATGSALSLSNVQDSDVATYTVDVSNLAGMITSEGAALTVFDPPAITSQPQDRTNNATTTATFSVALAANSTPPFGYQWFKNGTNLLVDGGNIIGATSNVLSVANVLAADQGQYSVQVSNEVAVITSSNALLTVVDPYITGQPVSVTNRLGGAATFAVTAVGTNPLTYQWQQNGTAVSGATGSAYSIASIRDSDAGTYQVTVNNAAGVATSALVTLTVTHPPVIATQPTSLVLDLGQQAVFNVRANGATPFAYQWRRDGADIPGAKSFTYVISAVTANDAGAYSVLVSNIDGTALSASATLAVIIPPAITSQPTSVTNLAGGTVSFSVEASGTAPSYYWYKNATNLLSDIGNISGSSSNVLTLTNVLGADAGSYSVVVSNRAGLVTSTNASLVVIDPIIRSQPVSVVANLGASASFTVGAYGSPFNYQWRKEGSPIAGADASTYALTSVTDADVGSYDVLVTNAYGSVSSAVVTLTVIDPPVITQQPVSLSVNATSDATFTVVASGTSPSYQWRKGGVDITGATASSLTLLNVSQFDAADYTVFISNAAGSRLSDGAHLTVVDQPVILAGPSSRTNLATSAATFTVVAAGSPAVFQWFLFGTNALADGGNIFGVTSNVLTITNVLGVDSGEYSVRVSNAAGVAWSTNATLFVVDPVIVAQPASTTNTIGSTATFSVTAVGTTPLNYQWYLDGYELIDQTNRTLVLQAITDSDAGDYTVMVSNSEGKTLSEIAQLVTFPPLIVTQPANQVAVVGGPASFSVDVNGQVPFSYQWQKDGVEIFGATSRTYTLQTVSLADAAGYRVVVTNPLGSETSHQASLSIYAQPYLSIVNCSADSITVSVLWVPSQTCVLEASTDFVTWTPLVTNTAPFIFTDSGVQGSGKRFYRAHTAH